MALSEKDKQWIEQTIRSSDQGLSINAVAERGFFRNSATQYGALWTNIGALAVLITIFLTLGGFALSEHSAATKRAAEEASFEADARARTARLEEDVKELKTSVANLQLKLVVSKAVTPETAAEVAALTQNAASQHQTLDPKTILEAGTKLLAAEAVRGAWPALGSLVSYRFSGITPETEGALPDCYDDPRGPTVGGTLDRKNGEITYGTPPITPAIYLGTYALANCKLDLDDRPDFSSTTIGKYAAQMREMSGGEPTVLTLHLHHVQVIYHGGNLIPVDIIEFDQCRFDLELPFSPPPKGAKLVTQLFATDPQRGSVSLVTNGVPS